MTEVRHKLTEKQYSSYTAARQRAIETTQLAQAAREQLQLVADLLLDFYGVNSQSRTTIDDATKELVVTPPEAAPVDSKPAAKSPSKRRVVAAVAAPAVPAAP
jgi:hypothetical protein